MAEDARLHQPALSSIQREAGALSSDLEGASDSAQDAAELGGCSASGGRVCGTLQHGTVAQCVGLCDAQGPAGGSAPGEIYAARDRKLEAAREQRRQRRANLEIVL